VSLEGDLQVLALSSDFERGDDVSLDKLLALDAPPLVPQEDALEKAAPSLRVLDAEVQVYNSYAIKEQVCLAYYFGGVLVRPEGTYDGPKAFRTA
jgi:hypothetical protein